LRVDASETSPDRPLKFLEFANTRWPTAAILKSKKNIHIFATVWPILTKFGIWDLQARLAVKISGILKIHDGGRLPFWLCGSCLRLLGKPKKT